MIPGAPATSRLPPTRRRGAVGDWFVEHTVDVQAGSDRAGRTPEATADVTADPQGIRASGLAALFDICEIDVVHAIAVESPEDPQGVGPGVLESVHHATWHKNGISRTNRQGLVANVSHSRAR